MVPPRTLNPNGPRRCSNCGIPSEELCFRGHCNYCCRCPRFGTTNNIRRSRPAAAAAVPPLLPISPRPPTARTIPTNNVLNSDWEDEYEEVQIPHQLTNRMSSSRQVPNVPRELRTNTSSARNGSQRNTPPPAADDDDSSMPPLISNSDSSSDNQEDDDNSMPPLMDGSDSSSEWEDEL